MFSFFSGFNLLGKAITIVVPLVVIAILYAAYDEWHNAPLEECEESKISQAEEHLKAIEAKNRAMYISAVVISDQGQEIYDLNQSIKRADTKSKSDLAECVANIKNLKKEIEDGKIDYTKHDYYFKLLF